MIEEYKFGSITIDGKEYNYDVEARWTGEILVWRFKERHLVGVEEAKRAIEQNPETIVIGTGESGMVEVAQETKEEIKSKGIKLIIDKTEEAVETFNMIKKESKEEGGKERKIIGLFHLTC